MISLGNLLAEAERVEVPGIENRPVAESGKDGASLISTGVLEDVSDAQRVLAADASRAAVWRDRVWSGASWDPDDFAEKQTQGLIQQVFFPGWPRPSRQVVFSAVEQSSECAEVCARVACHMARELPGTVCAVEANPHDLRFQDGLAALASVGDRDLQRSKPHREAIAVAHNLWLLRGESFLGQHTATALAGWLRSRLSELRREFDYTVIHAPPAGCSSETAVLGQLSDGIILVLRANKTRRVVARSAKEMLQAANVRVLGFVLDRRTFPIPQLMYRSV